MKVFSTCFSTTDFQGNNHYHTALVLTEKKDGGFRIKYSFGIALDHPQNTSHLITGVDSEKEAFKKFVENDLFWAAVKIGSFTEIKM